jgi:hypothetical protein
MDDNQKANQTLFPVLAVVAALLLLVGVAYFVAGRSGAATVAGQATLDSQPLAGAQVVFIGEDEKNQAPVVALTNNEGNYKLVGNQGGGIPAGKYKVMVSKVTLPDGTVPTGERLEQARAKGLLNNSLPKIYEDRSTSPLHFDVRPGDNKVDLPLKKRP